MAEEIINRIANSKLVTFDLEDFYPVGERISFDISPWLLEGIVLKEQDFRAAAIAHDWTQYQDNYVSLHCSTDAIIPGWAYMLLTTYLSPFAKKVAVGTLEDLETILFSEIIEKMEIEDFKDKPVIIKGCAHKPIPQNAFVLLTARIQTVAKSIMYGEACSSVPLYKKNR